MQTRAEPQSELFESVAPHRQMVVRRGGRSVLRWAFAAVGYGLLTLAWLFASPLGAAPDEAAHAVRAAAAGEGRWQGTAVTPYERNGQRTPAQAGLLNLVAQEFTVPARLLLPNPCFAGRPDQSAACANVQPGPQGDSATVPTYETTAPPAVYAVAGAAMRLAQVPLAPGYLGRLALALLCALLLAGAAWAAGGRGALWPLVGLALAATPMVLFLAASIGTAGVAAAAGICLAAALGAFWLGPPRRGLEAVIAVSAVALALSSAAGALSLVALLAVVLPLVEPRRLTRPAALLASIVVTAAAVTGVALALDHRPLPPGHVDLGEAVPVVARSAPDLLARAVGAFGWGDVTLPAALVVGWGALVVLGVATALVIGGWRDRIALLLALAAAFGLAVAAEAFVLAPVGWDLTAPFLLPVLGAVPVLAGLVLHRARVRPRADALLVGVAVIGFQLVAFGENARRYAVGRHGPIVFPDVAQWAPPAGWLPWLVVAGAGGLLVLLALWPLRQSEYDEELYGPLIVVDPLSVGR
ncbi:MAG TPA: DUF2142 domain-containing protein [Candidatus Dormibacteraeota bacterium]|nr:DUF2142 domain-containing protein [Candidatus Dormibacteraeota bacterium]